MHESEQRSRNQTAEEKTSPRRGESRKTKTASEEQVARQLPLRRAEEAEDEDKARCCERDEFVAREPELTVSNTLGTEDWFSDRLVWRLSAVAHSRLQFRCEPRP
jgi:hypothetical protein